MKYLYRHQVDNGQLTMAVISPDTKTVLWKAVYPSFTEDKSSGELIEDATLMELGVMKNLNDVSGLDQYLKQAQVISDSDVLTLSFVENLNKRMHSYAIGGVIDDKTQSLLNEFEYAKQSHAHYGGGKWVNRIPKVVTAEQLSFIPTDGSVEMDRISKHLIYGLDKYKYDKDQKRFILAGLKTGKLKIVETPSYKYKIIHSGSFADGGRLSAEEDTGGRFDRLTPEAAIARIKKGQPLVNLKDDYRVQYNGNGKFAISFPSGQWETMRVDEKELLEYLGSANAHETSPSFAKGGKVNGFDKMASNIGKKLVGKKVPKKYQKQYGKTYDNKDAKIAGKNIAGSIVNEKREEKKEETKKPVKNKKTVEKEVVVKPGKAVKEENANTPKSAPIETSLTRAEEFKLKYGVNPEELYHAFKQLSEKVKLVHYPYMILSHGDMKEKLPGINMDAINKNNELAYAWMLLALTETHLLNELKGKIDDRVFDVDMSGELFIPSYTKPAMPKPTELLESFSSLVSKDDLRPAMMGVYMDAEAQQMAATNTHVLGVKKADIKGKSRIISLADISEKIGGKRVRAGDEIDAHYPQYKVVIPEGNALVLKAVAIPKLYEQINGVIKADKLFDNRNTSVYLRIETSFGDSYFDPYLMQDLLKFFLRNGIGQVDIEIDPNMPDGINFRGVILRDSVTPTTFGLIMPIYGVTESAFYKTLKVGTFSLVKDYKDKKFEDGGAVGESGLVVYTNRYGTVKFRPVTEYMPVKNISFDKLRLPETILFDIDTAEKIVLITDNRNSQISFPPSKGEKNQLKKAYFIHHSSTSVAAACELVSIDFISDINPTEEIKLHAMLNEAGVNIMERGGIVSEDTLHFIKGKAEIKKGRKVIAKVYYRPDFYREHNIKSQFSEKYPYSIEINGVGHRECESLKEALSKIEEYTA